MATLLLASRAVLGQAPAPLAASGPTAAPQSPGPVVQPDDFAVRSSPWVDLTLTSLWLEERTSGFWNVGVQAGGYLLDRLRLSARLVVPLGEMSDDVSEYSFDSGRVMPSREVSVIYGATVGVVIAGTRNFVFAPGLVFLRTDVDDYGSSLGLLLPFEWTTSRSMRIGFELSAGQSFGGSVQISCQPDVLSCQPGDESRPSGTSIMTQFHVGWSLGSL